MKQHCIKLHNSITGVDKQIAAQEVTSNHYTLIDGHTVEYMTTYTKDGTINIFINDPLTGHSIEVYRLQTK